MDKVYRLSLHSVYTICIPDNKNTMNKLLTDIFNKVVENHERQYIKLTYTVLTPTEFSGNANGDYGYKINGTKSKNGYVSKSGARNAMHRKVKKLLDTGNYTV